MPEYGKQEKSKGGDELNPEEIRSVVEQVLAKKEEKDKTSGELGEIRSEVGELRGELGKVKEGMFCDPSGKYCFRTPQELSDFMEKQTTKMEGIEAKIGEVISQVKGIGEAGKKPTLPPGVQRLLNVTPEIRATMSKEDNEARDAGLKAIANYFNASLNDLWRLIERDSISLDNIAKKGNMRKRVFDGISDQELKDVTLMACKDGKCRPFREGMEKEAGIKFYAKDKRGRFQPVDQEEKEGPHI